MIALSGVPATIQVRGNRKFVTQVAWNGDEAAAKGTPGGCARRLAHHHHRPKARPGHPGQDGLEDTEIRGVHKVTLALPSAAMMKPGTQCPTCPGRSQSRRDPFAFDASPFEQSSTVTEKRPGKGFSSSPAIARVQEPEDRVWWTGMTASGRHVHR